MPRYASFVAISLLAASIGAFGGQPPLTEASACRILRSVAEREHLALPAHSGEYECDLHASDKQHYVFGLRLLPVSKTSEVGSTLVGWYAVRKKDAAVIQWNIADERPTKVTYSAPGEPKDQK